MMKVLAVLAILSIPIPLILMTVEESRSPSWRGSVIIHKSASMGGNSSSLYLRDWFGSGIKRIRWHDVLIDNTDFDFLNLVWSKDGTLLARQELNGWNSYCDFNAHRETFLKIGTKTENEAKMKALMAQTGGQGQKGESWDRWEFWWEGFLDVDAETSDF